MRIPKWAVIVSLSLNAIGLVYLGNNLYSQYQRHERFEQVAASTYYYMNRDRLFKILPNDSNEIIFFGDSHIHLAELHELFSNCNVKNRGIGGDVTNGLYYRVEEVLESRPVKLFIEVGTNDVLREVQEDTIISYYRYLLKYIKYKSPATKLYVLSIFPNGWFVEEGKRRANIIVNDLNNKLKALCAEEGIRYIDFTNDLSRNGRIIPQYYLSDSLHLSAQGYALFRDKLKKYVDE